jgi:hypothetical protein
MIPRRGASGEDVPSHDAPPGMKKPSGGGTGLHWDELDEDISVAGLLLGIGDRTAGRQAVAR